MFISVNAITDLIEKYNSLLMSENYIHHPVTQKCLLNMVTDLSRLVEEEEAHMEKMAADWEDQEYGRCVMEDAHNQKLIEQDMARFDWPGGV